MGRPIVCRGGRHVRPRSGPGGELAAADQLTALYVVRRTANSGEALGELRIRYRLAGERAPSTEDVRRLPGFVGPVALSRESGLALGVAALAEKLSGAPWRNAVSWSDVAELVEQSIRPEHSAEDLELLELVHLAEVHTRPTRGP